MKIITEKIVPGGSCIGRIDGKAVFVPFALPGETLDVTITQSRKDYDFAKINGIEAPSPRRIAPPCPLFGKCGGCSLQMADGEYQKELRLSILRSAIERAKLPYDGTIDAVSGDDFGYRARFQFHRANSGGAGLKEGKNDAVVPLDDCPIARDEVRNALRDGSLSAALRARKPGERYHVFGYDEKLWKEDGDTDCRVRVGGKTVSFDVRGFFQSNIPLLDRLAKTAFDRFSGERLLDLYSGVGTFSVFAEGSWRETTLVEHNAASLARAEENLAGSGLAPTFCAVSDDEWPRHTAARKRFDGAIVDPPRSGVSRAALDWLIAADIPEIRYVSCDPVTFARDGARLAEAGFILKKATLFDFYPQTHHVETLGIFTRSRAAPRA